MKVKEGILRYLSENGDKMSGEKLASLLGVSRAAVWKAVQGLKKEGFVIEGEAGKGYSLVSSPCKLTETEICRYKKSDVSVFCFSETESTNTLAKLSDLGYGEKKLFVAEKQTGGRGRLGRRFISPDGGIYMSYLFSPCLLKGEEIVSVTSASCVAVCRAISEVCFIETGIKWVNDLYYNHKKVCGILTEAVTCAETGETDRVIIGIGINFSTPEDAFPEDLRSIAGSLFKEDTSVSPARLVAAIADRLSEIEESCISGEFAEEYKSRSIVIGRNVVCHKGNECFSAKVRDINSRGGLEITDSDGRELTLSSGEITLRAEEGSF